MKKHQLLELLDNVDTLSNDLGGIVNQLEADFDAGDSVILGKQLAYLVRLLDTSDLVAEVKAL